MFKNLFKKSYTSINTNDHGSAGVSRAESAKADKRAAEAAQEKPEKIPSRPTAMTPESLRSLWRKCNKCEKPILVQDVKDNLYVCPRCGGYFRMHAYRGIEMLIDDGTFEEWDKEMSVVNPLAFPGYEGKVEAAREKTDLNEAVVTGKGKIHGYETVIAVCDSRFLMSSMGHNMGEKIARAVERATEERLPVIIYAASGGARMQEGMISLMQMAKTSAALKRHSEAGLLYISFMTDWICGSACHRADDRPEAPGGLPESRVPADTRFCGSDRGKKRSEACSGTDFEASQPGAWLGEMERRGGEPHRSGICIQGRKSSFCGGRQVKEPESTVLRYHAPEDLK